jgi:hypothetical protein
VADWLTRPREAAAEEGRAGLRGVLRGRAEAGMGEENNSDRGHEKVAGELPGKKGKV